MRAGPGPALAALMVLVALGVAPASRAATFTVDSTADPGDGSCVDAAPCTLRDAITDANAEPGLDTIEFSVAGTISPEIKYPFITSPVFIEGESAPGWEAGAPVVEIEGSLLSEPGPGLLLSTGASGSMILGLVINRFASAAIGAQSGVAGNTIRGNFLGTNLAGTAAGPGNDVGISLNSSSNVIGGPALADRNVISGNGFWGITIGGGGTDENVIQGNYIGTDKTGSFAIGNEEGGVLDAAGGSTIGGLAPGEGNVISGNLIGLQIAKGAPEFGESSEIVGNLIGTNAAGTAAIGNEIGIYATSSDGSEPLLKSNVTSGNSGWGIRFDEAKNFSTLTNKIGTDAAGVAELGNSSGGVRFENGAVETTMQGDTIAFNGGPGIDVNNAPAAEVALLEGSLFSNAGLGIDLGSDGVTQNDPLDADGLTNRPILSTATVTTGTTTVTGTLAAAPGATYLVQLYASSSCDTSGSGEGKTYLGKSAVSTDGAGDASFSSTLSELPVGEILTATATSEATDSTSEFSACVSTALPTPSPSASPAPASPPPNPLPMAGLAAPVRGKTVTVAPVSGRVLIRVGKRGKFRLLAGGETIPVGSRIDATHGRVRLTSVGAGGALQSADFYGGRFRVTQRRGSPLTTLILEGRLSRCHGRAGTSRSRGGRHLWGSGKGRFQTRGHHGAATVRGTIWFTADRCDVTLFKVRRGVVTVRDFTRRRTIKLRAGHRYLARAP